MPKIINYNNYLIRFLENKSLLAGRFYFVIHDREAISLWSNDICKSIWNRLCDNILLGGCHGLSFLLCPFCLKYRHDRCRGCEWAKSHGRCNDDASDVHRARNKKQFTNEFYRDIIKKILKSEK
jgi:hypothetical protein